MTSCANVRSGILNAVRHAVLDITPLDAAGGPSVNALQNGAVAIFF
jgi:hypothetical protein